MGGDDGTGMDEGREGGRCMRGGIDIGGARDVAGTDIGAEGGAKVAEALTMNTTLTHLDLSGKDWWEGRDAGGERYCGGRGRGGDGAGAGMVMLG